VSLVAKIAVVVGHVYKMNKEYPKDDELGRLFFSVFGNFGALLGFAALVVFDAVVVLAMLVTVLF
jgi:hypothetical protein